MPNWIAKLVAVFIQETEATDSDKRQTQGDRQRDKGIDRKCDITNSPTSVTLRDTVTP